MILIDSHDVIDLLRQVVTERGEDFVYTDTSDGLDDIKPARYVRDGAPSCIVGHVLHRAGVPLERIAILDDGALGDEGAVACLAEDIGAVIGHVTGEAEVVLGAAQGAQDTADVTWGAALEAAETAYAAMNAQNEAEAEEYAATRAEA